MLLGYLDRIQVIMIILRMGKDYLVVLLDQSVHGV